MNTVLYSVKIVKHADNADLNTCTHFMASENEEVSKATENGCYKKYSKLYSKHIIFI